ncbi:MAG: hypothetical protein HY674_17870, partial [Chloroflexi bacterium]|nr:hypothetical protein [Chloroflexota bacterium]
IIDERTEATNLEFSYAGFAGGAPGVQRQTAAAPPAGQSGHASRVREIVSALHAYEHELERRLATFRILADAIDAGTDLGPGRGDSFGIIRDLLFPFDPVTLEAPVSTPHLFNFRDFKFIHWDGNTTSVMDRNIAQAVALGADFDKTTFKSAVLPRNLHRLETVALKIHPPKWPEEVLGNIDRAKAARGQPHYQRLCHECHQSENIYPVEKVGTSPLRATNMGQTVANLPFPQQLAAFASQAKFVCCKDHGIEGEEAKQMERTDKPVWRSTGGYIARPLAGAWATAPFLHNGSVPTLYDLLQPQARRPARFPVGHRDYDPRKVGFTTDIKSPVWTFDTQLKGNSNSGHEFGAGLSEDEKWELIEYLKTI